jgi:hypothetical protein
MKKSIALAMAIACLAALAFAGTNDANQTITPPNIQQNTKTLPDAQPGSKADKRDDVKKGLGRSQEDCNKGCIGGNPS